MLTLNNEEMKKAFTMRNAIDADKEALKLYTEGKAIVPLRTNIDVKHAQGQALFMPAFVGDVNACGVKIVSVYPNNIEKGLPSVPANMVLIDGDTGIVNCILDGTYLTQLRTGAVSGAATELLSRKDSKIMALIGTGGQAITQAISVCTVRPIEEIRVFDLNHDRTVEFVEELKKHIENVKIIASNSSDEAIENADVITTVTTSPVPTFDGSKIKKGVHINGVGSYTPDKRELDEVILKKASKVYLDTIDGVLSEAGDFIIPFNNGTLDKSIITGELGELILGTKSGRENEDDITVFKTVGSAVLDVVVAHKIYENAKALNLGTNIEI